MSNRKPLHDKTTCSKRTQRAKQQTANRKAARQHKERVRHA